MKDCAKFPINIFLIFLNSLTIPQHFVKTRFPLMFFKFPANSLTLKKCSGIMNYAGYYTQALKYWIYTYNKLYNYNKNSKWLDSLCVDQHCFPDDNFQSQASAEFFELSDIFQASANILGSCNRTKGSRTISEDKIQRTKFPDKIQRISG